jgi:hypothetical protein
MVLERQAFSFIQHAECNHGRYPHRQLMKERVVNAMSSLMNYLFRIPLWQLSQRIKYDECNEGNN